MDDKLPAKTAKFTYLENLYIYGISLLYVTRFNKTDRIVTFCISRNTKSKYSNHCGSFLLESSYIKFTA